MPKIALVGDSWFSVKRMKSVMSSDDNFINMFPHKCQFKGDRGKWLESYSIPCTNLSKGGYTFSKAYNDSENLSLWAQYSPNLTIIHLGSVDIAEDRYNWDNQILPQFIIC